MVSASSWLASPSSVKESINQFLGELWATEVTSPFHGGNRGSNPLGDASDLNNLGRHLTDRARS
jgi:hypothetical protein